MLRLRNNQSGSTHLVAVLAILAIGVIGAVALRVSNAYRFNYPGFNYPTITRPAGGAAICSSNGIVLIPPAGQSCSINQDASGVHCYINGAPTTCPVSNTGSVSYPGTPGATSNNTSTTTVNGSNGSTTPSTCRANGHGITGPSCSISSDANGTHCYIANVERPCDY